MGHLSLCIYFPKVVFIPCFWSYIVFSGVCRVHLEHAIKYPVPDIAFSAVPLDKLLQLHRYFAVTHMSALHNHRVQLI